MKNIFKSLPLLAACLFFARCSDERIDPIIKDDIGTHASAYADQFVTIKIETKPDDHQLEFYITGDWQELSINWGDGTTETRTENTYDYDSDRFYHHYGDQLGSFTVVLSGDIDRLMSFIMEDENVKVNSIHLGGMIGLETLALQNIPDGPATLNLSQNRKIEYFTTANTPTLTDIIIPVTNKLFYFSIKGNTKLTTSIVDRLVARVHDSVVISPREGTFNIESGQGNMMIGPPSSYTINKLRKLQNVYGWSVAPFVQ